jgi:glycosyltransferase involved in cell wall biosynthesis
VAGVHVYRYPILFGGSGLVAYLWEYGYSLLATFVLSWVVLLRRGFDVVHTHNPPDTGVIIGGFYKWFGKQFIYDQHDLAPEMYEALFRGGKPQVHGMLVRLEQLSSRQADRIIVTNQSHQRMIMQRSGVPSHRITIVRNGPDLERLRVTGPSPLPPLGEGMVRLCYVGVMGRHDGIDHLLHALRYLVYELRRANIECVLVGAGSAWQEMKKLSEQLQLQAYVNFVGWVDPKDVGRYLQAADICLAPEPSNPYNDRCTAIKIAEYMALGKPVIAFDLPEHRVTAQQAALYAEANSGQDFARQIALLLDDPARRRQLGEIGRERVERELAWSYQSHYLLDVYESLAAAMPRPAEDVR